MAAINECRYHSTVIPAGYLLKRVAPPPGWLQPGLEHVTDVCSVSDCVNDNIVDLQTREQHNGFGLASTPRALLDLAKTESLELSDAKLFYYETYPREMESDGWIFEPGDWRPLTALSSPHLSDPIEPVSAAARLLGYDVVVFGDYLEHSPLSCNSVGRSAALNAHCLFDSCDAARIAINSGMFGGGCEEGIYRIMSVSIVDMD